MYILYYTLTVILHRYPCDQPPTLWVWTLCRQGTPLPDLPEIDNGPGSSAELCLPLGQLGAADVAAILEALVAAVVVVVVSLLLLYCVVHVGYCFVSVSVSGFVQ